MATVGTRHGVCSQALQVCGKTHVQRALLPQAGVQRAEGRTWLPKKVASSGSWALVVGDGGEVPGCGRGKHSTWNPSHE